jgi:hypothetical protein
LPEMIHDSPRTNFTPRASIAPGLSDLSLR